MPSDPKVVTTQIIQMVEQYVWKELDDARKYGNRTPLDESGIWSLHRLCAEIYSIGFRDGEFVEAERQRYIAQRAIRSPRAHDATATRDTPHQQD